MLDKEKLQKAIADYLQHIEEKNTSERTLRSKTDYLRWLVDFLGDKPYNLENILAFRSYMYTRWTTPSGKDDITRFLRSFTNWLAKYEYIEKSFADKLEKPYMPHRISFDYVDPIIVDQIIDIATKPLPFVFGKKGDNARNRRIKNEMLWALRFLLRTGLRISELLKLSGSDIVLNDQTPAFWVISKGSKGEKDYLPLPKDMLEELGKRVNNKRLFGVTEKTCNDVLKRGCEKLKDTLLQGRDVSMTCHTLRHIFATNLTKQGVPIQTISRLLRHRNIKTTIDYYQHLNVNDLSVVINNQSIVRNGLELDERIDLIQKAIASTGVENDDRLLVSWKRKKNGGFIFEVDPKNY